MHARVIAFDVYQTLARPAGDPVRPIEVQDLLQRFGLPASYQAIKAAREFVFYFDAPKREIHGYVDFLALQFDRMGLRVNLDVIESIAAMHEKRDAMTLYDDALAAIDAAHARGLRAVAFTTLPVFMLGQRAAAELLPRLDAYFDASATGYPKGDPRFYQAITDSLGVAPGEIRCIGDDATCDCLLPQRAGWQPTLLVRDDFAAADAPTTFPRVRTLTQFAESFS